MKFMFILLAAAWPWAVQAQAEAATVWRCGADGRTYSDAPCAGGRPVDVPAPRSATEIAAAQAQADQERRFADRLVRERQQRENLPAGAGLSGIRHTRLVQISSPVTQPKKRQASRRHQLKRSLPVEGADTLPATVQVTRQKQG